MQRGRTDHPPPLTEGEPTWSQVNNAWSDAARAAAALSREAAGASKSSWWVDGDFQLLMYPRTSGDVGVPG